MTARLSIGTSSPDIISEDQSASTASVGTAEVSLHIRDPWLPVSRTRAGYSFSVVVAIQADTVADKKTARDAIMATLNREYEDIVFEQTTGTERITMKVSTGEVYQWMAETTEEDGHLATVIQITFRARTRIQSGGGGTDPVLNPPGLLGEISFNFFQNNEGTSTWTIIAVFVGDGTSDAYILANEWAEALDTTRPAFLKDTYNRVERSNNLNGLTGTTRIELVYAIPTRVKVDPDDASSAPVTLPDEVAFAEYSSAIEPYLEVDSRLTDEPLQMTASGYIVIRIDQDQVFDPDDPDALAETDTPAKIAEVIQLYIDRAMAIYGLTGKASVDLRLDYGRADAGGRATWSAVKLFGTNGFISAKEEVNRPSEDNFTIIPDDESDWVYRPTNSVRHSATQVMEWTSEGEKSAPFGDLSGFIKRLSVPTDPTGLTLTLMDTSTGQVTRRINLVKSRLTNTYVKANEGSSGATPPAPAQVGDAGHTGQFG